MNGSTPKTYSLEELKTLPSETDWDRVRREAREGIEPEEDEDSPDAAEWMRAEIDKHRQTHRIGGSTVTAKIRFDREVLESFRAGGPGWQARMNQALKEWIRAHPSTE